MRTGELNVIQTPISILIKVQPNEIGQMKSKEKVAFYYLATRWSTRVG